ncbi:muts domain V-domain-containing protein [Microdochium trichocladiopsis]|uniref:DNA mismatch repair protein MSH3 n=1 Tax=Microdochium trichocladiopsis TaxID=1682393 RepID=A0A9P9BST6_9PEZI|nr:muts domain V-domain-containing protein [Microdochium trichocladiopsis]KAH7034787.1 muts domain V-domain-containing protein [Microdochium trichocladiopsis]
MKTPFRSQNTATSRPSTSLSQHTTSHYQHSATPGRRSRAASSVWGGEQHQVICAISESRGISPTVGLALVNISTNEAILSQICDTQFFFKTITKLQVYHPCNILMCDTSSTRAQRSRLLSVLEHDDQLHNVQVHYLDREYWSETAGVEYIQTLAFKADLEAIKVAIQGHFFATCAFAAVIKFVEASCQLSIASHTLRVRYQPSEHTMMIDASTIHSLELIQNLHNPKSKDSLFGLLNETVTPMGSRLLRSTILQPSTQVESVLNPRYEAVQELAMKEDVFFEVRKALKGFIDVEKLLTSLVIVPHEPCIAASEMAIDNVLAIKSFIMAVGPLYESLMAVRSSLLVRIRDLCRPEMVHPVIELIRETINDDVISMKTPIDRRNQRSYAVRTGVNGLLDVARQTYKEGTEDIYQLVDEINNTHETDAEVKFDDRRGFWLRLRRADFDDKPIPDVLINMTTKGPWIECQTMSLVQLSNRVADSHSEIVILSDRLIQELINKILEHVPSLFRICEGISLLDMLAAFCQTAAARDYARPEMSDTLALKHARHPICERVHPDRFVPNDVFANQQHRFQIITGCNMSGKSTYIRMVALIQVMAQMGSFVPAEYAAVPIVHQLFVRMSTDDSIEANMSTFSLEMREMAFILRNVDQSTLAIIDELGRGTSTRDGLAIAVAISEALLQSGSTVWFATHFQQLARILGSRPGVLNLHLGTKVEDMSKEQAKMTMLYKVNSGPVQVTRYGLNLARAIGLPQRFVDVADTVAQQLEAESTSRKQQCESQKLSKRRRLILNLHETLSQLRTTDMDGDALRSYLEGLQEAFVLRMEAINSNGHSES